MVATAKMKLLEMPCQPLVVAQRPRASSVLAGQPHLVGQNVAPSN